MDDIEINPIAQLLSLEDLKNKAYRPQK